MHTRNMIRHACFLAAIFCLLVSSANAQSSLFGIKLEGGASPRTVLIFGDSISAGESLPKSRQDGSWVRLLETQTQGLLTCINDSRRDRSTSAVADFDAAMKKKREATPDIIAIMLGTEDSRDPSVQCVTRAVSNLRTIVASARRKFGPQFPVLLIAPPNLRKSDLPSGAATPEQRDANLKSLAVAYAKLAQETKCAFASAYGVIADEHFSKGGLLPDENGHIALANALLPALLKAAGVEGQAR